MTYKNNKLLSLIIVILIFFVIIWLFKSNDETYVDTYIDTKSSTCLTEADVVNLQQDLNALQSINSEIDHLSSNSTQNLEQYKNQLKFYVNNLLNLFQKITSTQLTCILNDKNQVNILNEISDILDKNKETLRKVRQSLMNKFSDYAKIADILPSQKTLKLNNLDNFGKLFNNLSYILNDNDDYTIDENNNIHDKTGKQIGTHVHLVDNKGNKVNKANLYKHISPKNEKTCGFMCKHNTSYHDPTPTEPQHKYINLKVN